MIKIAISVEAFEAIAQTLPLGSVGYENKTNEQGQRLIWLDRAIVNRLRAMRRAGEPHSDAIVASAGRGWRAHALDSLAGSRAVSAHLLFPPSATVLCSARRG